MILDTTTKSIQVVLAAAATTNQPSFSASYADLTTSTFTPAANDGTANGTTPVTMIAAPAASTQRQLKNLTIYNADTVNATVSVQLVDGANTRTLYKATLVSGASLQWTPDAGFTIPQTLTSNTPDFISGLKLVWNSGTSISVNTGEAWIPGSNALVQNNSVLTLSGLSLSASSLYHVYLYLNAGVPAIECVTTAPDTPYFGTARAKTGDTTRRYLGSILTSSANAVYSFEHTLEHGRIDYRVSNLSGPLLLLTNGRATVATNVSLSSIAPTTATHGVLFLYNDPTTSQTVYYAASDGPTVPSGLEGFVVSGGAISALLRLDGNQAFSYAYAGAVGGSNGFTVRVSGYAFER